MKISKKILAFFLALILTFSLGAGCASVFAEEAEPVDVLTGFTGEEPTGTIVTFGSYPQSEVKDSSLIALLDAVEKNWVSYNYYTGTGNWYDGKAVASDYMRYADFTFSGQKYRAVVFDHYRPYYTGEIIEKSYMPYNDFGEVGRVYYFLYEPLKWRVLDAQQGLLMCASIIDAQPLNNYIYMEGLNYYGDPEKTRNASDYSKCDLRTWLNSGFISTAFSSEEQARLVTTHIQSKSAFSGEYADYDAADSDDKVFLLSFEEAMNPKYGFSDESFDSDERILYGTDYAKCQGLVVYTNKYENSWWWLRNPAGWDNSAGVVNYGYVVQGGYCVTCTEGGIVPAVRIEAKTPSVISVTSSKQVEIGCKSKFNLPLVVEADKGASYTVTYSSNNPKIAAVSDEGEISALKKGTAIISATVTDNLTGKVFTTQTMVKVTYSTVQEIIVNLLFGWIWYV